MGSLWEYFENITQCMMTSSNGNIFRVTGHLCGEFTGPGEFPAQRLVTRGFDVFFDVRLNKRLSKQPWGWWFETPAWSLWRQRNGYKAFILPGVMWYLCTMPQGLHSWTHRGWMTFIKFLVTCPVPSHYPNQCWLIIQSALKNKIRWNVNQNKGIFID